MKKKSPPKGRESSNCGPPHLFAEIILALLNFHLFFLRHIISLSSHCPFVVPSFFPLGAYFTFLFLCPPSPISFIFARFKPYRFCVRPDPPNNGSEMETFAFEWTTTISRNVPMRKKRKIIKVSRAHSRKPAEWRTLQKRLFIWTPL